MLDAHTGPAASFLQKSLFSPVFCSRCETELKAHEDRAPGLWNHVLRTGTAKGGPWVLTAREAIDGKNGLGQTKGGIHEVEKNVFGRTVAGFVDGHIESGVVVQQPVHGPTAR